MKKFSFSLEKLLHYQESLLEDEKNKLTALRMEKAAVDAQIQGYHDFLDQQIRERTEKAAKGITSLELAGYGYTMDNTRRHIEELTVVQEKMYRAVEAQVAVVLDKTKEVSGLEKLREKRLEEYRYLEGKEEAVRINELVSRKYLQAQQEEAQNAV